MYNQNMSKFFYKLGKKIGAKFRKAKWLYQSLAGDDDDIIKIESQVGRDMVGEFRRQVEIDNNSNSSLLLDEIRDKLSVCVKNYQRKFSFTSIANTAPNAFALPGGYIFISRSLMELCRWDKNEIALALAHEMGHVVYKHSVNRILTNSAISIGISKFKFKGMFASWLKNAGTKTLECAYSRDNELEADDFAVRLAWAAGYEPSAAVDLFTRLSKIIKSENSDLLGRYLSTHPAFDVRIENVRKAISRLE